MNNRNEELLKTLCCLESLCLSGKMWTSLSGLNNEMFYGDLTFVSSPINL